MKVSHNIQLLTGAVFGICFGIFLTTVDPGSSFRANSLYIATMIGSIFINLLKMIIIPLVFTSVAVGIANLRAHAQMGRVWKITAVYFLATPFVAILFGLIFMNIFKPGYGLTLSMFQDSMAGFDTARLTLSEFLTGFLSGIFMNPVESMSKGMIVPTIVFAIFLGIGMVVSGERSKTVLGFLSEFFELIMMIIGWIMKILPIGIAALLVKLVATQNSELFPALGKYIALVVGVTLLHGFVILPLILYVLTKMNPVHFFAQMREALVTAFSTSSSSATLPVTYRCVKDNLKIDKDIVGFVLPLGATLNMDGTALYEAMAALFIANLVGVELNFAQQIVVAFMAMIASVGAPGIPSAGMVTMVMVLQSVGLPAEAIALLIPIDRPLDAIRTVVNVEGDAVCSVIVQRHAANPS